MNRKNYKVKSVEYVKIIQKLKSFKYEKVINNLSQSKHKVLLNQDKGRGIVILVKSKYIENCLNLINT